MHYLYASKPGVPRKLVATFDSEQQLLAYVGWATLKTNPDGTGKFEQGSALAGYQRWEKSDFENRMPSVSVLTAELGFKDREGTGRSLWSMLGERKRLGFSP